MESSSAWRVPCEDVQRAESSVSLPQTWSQAENVEASNHTQTRIKTTWQQHQRKIYCFTDPQGSYVMSERWYKAIRKINSSTSKEF